jgi:putative oxidoreductase
MISTMQTTAMPVTDRHGSLAGRILSLHEAVAARLQSLSPIATLALRLYVANVFINSGMTKIQSWDTTLQLFEYEYHVPLLSPAVAAYAGTFTELFFPVLLAFGLGGRLAAFVLFVFNIIAVISYPDLNAAGIEQHKVWGLMLFALLIMGPGRLSIDHWLRKFIAKLV